MRRILLVEDDAANRGALARLLRLKRKDFEIVETGTLAEAKFAFAEAIPDCTVLDLSLPDSGIEDTIKAMAEFCAAPVIAYTGVEDPTLFRRLQDAGAYSIITKGSPSETIIEKILLALIRSDRTENAADLGRTVLENRRENHHMNVPGQSWWTTTKILAATAAVVIGQAAIVVGWIWNQAAKDALREKTIAETAAAVLVLAPDVAHLKEQATVSINDRKGLHEDMQRNSDNVQRLRDDMHTGFQQLQSGNAEILKLMIEDRRNQAGSR